ncbi:LysR family transcriptional regulator [Pseudonocardia nigra]|uniref:LysR family transcriptional regulator n=1 Tax=Pseudonocardia nigra TaxID=1921578 RepID=UPI001C5E5A7F|nr:LysR family transcriptional regulator [Pseudonocardia nigra]
MIDLRRLHVLRVVDQLGTLTAAAHSLHLTPSAVSQQLRQLARELDVPLLEPDGRRVRLTPAAHALLRHADDLAVRWEQARGELQTYAEQAGRLLRLCGFPSSLDMVVAPAAAHLRHHAPQLRVRVAEVETADAFERLLAADVDIAVVVPNMGGPGVNDPRFEQQPLLDEPQDLLVPLGHPLAGRPDAALEEAAHDPWVLAAPGTCDQHELAMVACAAAGFSPDVVHVVKEWSAVASVVAHGLGVALVPRLVRIPTELPVARVPLRDAPTPRRRLLTCTRRGSRQQRHIALGLEALDAAARAATASTAPAA